MNQKQSARLEKFSELCTKCGGLGEITRFFGGGKFESTIDCDRCRGRGEIGNCTQCAGTGTIQGKQNVECPDCQGVGAVGDCPYCNGTGITLAGDSGECPNCNGFGFLNSSQE